MSRPGQKDTGAGSSPRWSLPGKAVAAPPVPTSVLEPGALFAGKFQVDGVLGRGGMSTVLAATNLAVLRRVAIKVMEVAELDARSRGDLLHRFQLEAQAPALVGHPGVVDVLDLGETEDGKPYIVMEYLEGATLKAVQGRLGVMSCQQVAAVMAPVLEVLDAVHRAGVVHRDIKPSNIFLCTRPPRATKLLDFGISRFAGSGLTIDGTTMGTPQYMAPEQILGERDLGPETDLYSAGVTMYVLLSGRPPFEADSDFSMVARVLQDSPTPLRAARPDVVPGLAELVDSLLTRDRSARPASAMRVRDRLLDLVRPEAGRLWELTAEVVEAQPSILSAREGARGPVPPPARPSSASGTRLARTLDEPSVPWLHAEDVPPTVLRASRPLLPLGVDDQPTDVHPGKRPPLATRPPAPAPIDRPRRRRWTGWLAGIALAALAVAGGWALGRGGGPPSPATVDAPGALPEVDAPGVLPEVDAPGVLPEEDPPRPEGPAAVTRLISTEPGASLVLDGVELDCEPCKVTRPAGTELDLIVRQDGRLDALHRVRFDEGADRRSLHLGAGTRLPLPRTAPASSRRSSVRGTGND